MLVSRCHNPHPANQGIETDTVEDRGDRVAGVTTLTPPIRGLKQAGEAFAGEGGVSHNPHPANQGIEITVAGHTGPCLDVS